MSYEVLTPRKENLPLPMLPCPFCGTENMTVMAQYYVECLTCGARGPTGDSMAETIQRWHKRTSTTTDGEQP